MAQVTIKKGYHANKELKNVTFHAVRPLAMGQRGPFLMVNGTGHAGFPQRNFKVFVDSPEDFSFSGPDAADFIDPDFGRVRDPLVGKVKGNPEAFLHDQFETSEETDDEIKARLAERFEIMERMAAAASRGTIKGLVISGAPGTGKSFGVEHALERDSIQDKLSHDPADPDFARRTDKSGHFKARYKFIKGFVTPAALYKQLYEYSNHREVLVFDDCDAVLKDDICLGLLKTALDTSGKRTLHWLNSSNPQKDDAPDHFEFKGAVIFITNIDFQRTIARGGALAPHLDAILDRCLYLDLTIKSKRDKLIRIEHVARDLGMLEKKGLPAEQIEEIMGYLNANADHFPRLSLRKLDQLADIRLADTSEGAKVWQREAEVMLLRNRH
jgi:hypothetical protein